MAQVLEGGEFQAQHHYDNVRKSNASSKINVLLSDGFDKLDDRVDVAVISGMGGSLISDILSKHTLYNLKRIILQPNNDSKAVREILSSIGFKIIDELIVKENDKFYEIIIIERGDCNYTELQLSFGPINLINQSNYFTERINVQIKRQNELLSQVNDKSRTVIITNQLKLLKEALK